MLSALARIGDVDLFVLSSGDRDPIAPSDAPPVRIGIAPRVGPGYRGFRRIDWAVRGKVPYEIFGRDYSALRQAFEQWRAPHYDMVWVNRAESYVALAPCVKGPVIVDLDDLEDRKLLAQLQVEQMFSDQSPVKKSWLRYRGQKDARLWASLQCDIARSVDAVAVTSELDRSRFGSSNAAVIPNGYAAPPRPVGRRSIDRPPTIMFQGLLAYGPNADAARFLVMRVLPELRSLLGEVRIRLVGLASRRVQDLKRVPGVTVTGPVESMSDELTKADVVLVPVRFGSGTRVKILEAFANRVPVVSTTLGAEGLAVEDGRHLLIADTAAGLAAACMELVSNPTRRAALVDEAEALFHRQYRWDRIEEDIRSLVSAVLSSSDPVTRS